MRTLLLLVCLAPAAALAAPKLEKVTLKPSSAEFAGGKGPEVEIAIAVSRTRFDTGACDAQVDFGDGSRPRTIDFTVAGVKIIKHTYSKGGNFNVSVKGSGKTPCEGTQTASLAVKGPAKPEAKKKGDEKKKPEPKKKAEPKKKTEKAKGEPKKKPAPKKDEKKKEA